MRTLSYPDAEMAPNSAGDFVADWENEQLKPGVYRLHLKAVYQGETWEWDEAFTIEEQDASQANDEAVNTSFHMPLWGYIAITLAIAVLAFLIGRRKKKSGRSSND